MNTSSGIPGASTEPGTTFTHDTPELAATYEEVSIRQFENGKQLVCALNISSGEHVLDIGAGTGRLGAYVAKIVGPSGRVVGIDPLPLRIEIAQSKAIGNFEARVGCAEDLSEFANAAFDVVYLNSVFHWVSDKPQALAEIFRVLKADGRLGLNCLDVTHPNEAFQFVRRAMTEAGLELDKKNLPVGLSGKELEAMVTGAGFVAYEGCSRPFINSFKDADDLLASLNSGSFGNLLVNVSEGSRVHVCNALDRLLEPKRVAGDGIRLERYLIFATARKPKVVQG
jgi:ubiquinone/menaquinone biosynthesis C-methylase UbiE